MIRLRILGTFEIQPDRQTLGSVRFRDAKTKSLLKYLVVHRGKVIRQEVLVELFWPASAREQGLASLQAAISHLRSTLRSAWDGEASRGLILRQPPGYMLQPGADCEVDHDRYLRGMARAEAAAAAGDWTAVTAVAQEAETLVQGEFLACEPYADWAEQERQAFTRLRPRLLDLALTACGRLGRWQEAEAIGQRSLELDPLREGTYRQLMLTYEALQEPALALRIYERCRTTLAEELGVEPGPATQALHARLLQSGLAASAAQAAHPSIPPRRAGGPHALPEPLTSFIGREPELASLTQLLHDHRLVTLTGAGGCGKSRLALQVARQFAGGVLLIDVAALPEAALLVQRVAAALDPEAPVAEPSPATLAQALAGRSLLLLLDGCERLRDAAADLAHTLLGACPELRILATSRTSLGVAGEALWHLLPLSLPDTDALPNLAPHQLVTYDAIRLLVERARLGRPGFTLDPHNSAAVVRLCQRLDGIPLALELAAARLRALGLTELLAKLDERLPLLTADRRSTPPRHQTLRAMVDWSYDLLGPEERRLFAQLSVFAGGFSLAAALAVCGGDDSASEVATLNRLTQLVEQSLVTTEDCDGEMRYRLLAPFRERAAELLRTAEEAPLLYQRHRDWYLTWGEAATLQLGGPERRLWLHRCDRDADNLLQAVGWCREVDDLESELRFAVGLAPLWGRSAGIFRSWLEELLAFRGTAALPAWHARTLLQAGNLALWQGEFGAAASRLAASLQIFRVQGDRRRAADAYECLAHVSMQQGDYERAAALLDEATALAPTQTAALSLARISLALYRGDLQQAETLNQALLEWAQAHQNPYAACDAHLNVGHIALCRYDYPRAVGVLEAALTVYREHGDGRYEALAMVLLVRALHGLGEVSRARALCAQCLALYRDPHSGVRRGCPEALEAAAALLGALRQQAEAVSLLGAAETLRLAARAPLHPVWKEEHARLRLAVESGLDATTLAAAWARGRMLLPQQALDQALRLLQAEVTAGVAD